MESNSSASLAEARLKQAVVTFRYAKCSALALAKPLMHMAAIKANVSDRPTNTPLFDAPAYTRNMERVSQKVWELTQAGLLPEHIELDA